MWAGHPQQASQNFWESRPWMIGRNVFGIFQESLSFMEIPVSPVNSGFSRNPGVFQESQGLPTPAHGFSRNKFGIFQKSLGFPHIPGSHSPGKAGNEFPISAGELPPVPAVFQREFGDSSGIQGLLILSFQHGEKKGFFLDAEWAEPVPQPWKSREWIPGLRETPGARAGCKRGAGKFPFF